MRELGDAGTRWLWMATRRAGWRRVEVEVIWIGGAATDWMEMDPEVGDLVGDGTSSRGTWVVAVGGLDG